MRLAHRKAEKERIMGRVSLIITVIIVMLVILSRIIASSIIMPGGVSGISITIIIGSVLRSTINGVFMEPPRSMPARVVITMPWIAVLGKRNTRSDKYQRSGDQQSFFN